MATITDTNVATRTKDGYVIYRRMPGFSIRKGRRHVADTDSWTEAVASVRVDREANRAIRAA